MKFKTKVVLTVLNICLSVASITMMIGYDVAMASESGIGAIDDVRMAVVADDQILYASDFTGVQEGVTVLQVLEQTVPEGDMSLAGGYLSEVIAPDGQVFGEQMGEEYSGWLYYVNGQEPTVGMADSTVESGDDILVVYMRDGVVDVPDDWDAAWQIDGESVVSDGMDIDRDGQDDFVIRPWVYGDGGGMAMAYLIGFVLLAAVVIIVATNIMKKHF